MASLRDIRKRIGSVKNTRQITKAMKMVSAAKLRRATDAAVSARPYNEQLNELVDRLVGQIEEVRHPLLDSREEIKKVRIILVAADKGLCGSYTSNIQKEVDAFVAEKLSGVEVSFSVIGKKGKPYVERGGYALTHEYADVHPSQGYEIAASVIAEASAAFIKGELDAVFVAYTKFKSALTQIPTVEQVIPFQLDVKEDESEDLTEYIYEPGQEALLGVLLPRLIDNRVYAGMLEGVASEHAARMMAMDNATRNASELIDKLTLQYNQARQAAITTELVEIVSGAEAL